MAGILKHRYTNPHADVGGSTKTQASHWNDFLMGVGGLHGDTLTRDTSDATYGIKWTSGGVAGVWQAVPFNAANFSAGSPMTFTVTAAGIGVNRYTRMGNTLIWSIIIQGTNAILGGTASAEVRLTLPGGYSAPSPISNPVAQCLTASVDTRAVVVQAADASQVSLYRLPSGNWSLGAFDLRMTITLEVA